MSLSGALSNAMSGLTANARGTSVLSANIANALNETYGRREITLTTDANQSSGGVRVANVERYANPILSHQKRLASADFAQKDALAKFSVELEELWGSVDTLGSVADKLTQFEKALLSAESDPSSETRLRNLAVSADAFATSIRRASDGVQDSRTRADHQIAMAVQNINANLSQIDGLNRQIMTAKHLGQDSLGLQDQRDAVLDQLSEFVPLHVIERESGAIAVFSSKGRTLVDGRAVELSFEKTTFVQPHMTVDNGLLSQLAINGDVLSPQGLESLAGARLGVLFDIRDNKAPDAQARMDAISREVVARFGPGGPDATILPGNAGIFTDGGAPFLSTNEIGLAGRIDLNVTLGSDSTDLWRWRDGLYASAQGDVGASQLMKGLRSQISALAVPASPSLGSLPQSLVGQVESLSSKLSADRVNNSDSASFAETQRDARWQAAAENGVNTDQELQKLIALEKSYAANARVVQVVDDMLAELLRI